LPAPTARHTAILAVINYLREHYTYSLEPNVPVEILADENGTETEVPVSAYDSNLETFLFTVKEGYCVHFASSAAALLREMGFAVRYAEGYIANDWDRTYAKDAVARYRTSVRDYNAHAWIEVYYPGMGWVQYETTPTFAEAIYDAEVTASITDAADSYYQQYLPEPVQESVQAEQITEEEEEYTGVYIGIAVIAGGIMLVLLLSYILRRRAEKAADKRAKLIRCAMHPEEYPPETDIHKITRGIIDCIFAIFNGLGCPHEIGELPVAYAERLDGEFGELAACPLASVIELIEKEEFGGTLGAKEIAVLGKYLEELQISVYAGLSVRQKFRMRYLKNLV